MSGTTTQVRLQPPATDPPIGAGGDQHSPAWTNFFQKVTDQLAALNNQVIALQGGAGQGITDGSDAAAGQIGEYLTASGAAGLASGALAGIVDLSLTAGDWDVSGGVLFAAGSGTHTYFSCGIDTIDARIEGAFSALVITQAINTAVHRYSLTATTTVQVVAQASFTGTVNASGTIRARRAR